MVDAHGGRVESDTHELVDRCALDPVIDLWRRAQHGIDTHYANPHHAV